jgi:DnaJ homolog subfamily C member 28
MSWIEIIADRKIREAQEEGLFDDLEGRGQPLRLEIDPRVPPELRAAYRLMKDARVLPDWIELEGQIRVREEHWEARLAAFSERHAKLSQSNAEMDDGPRDRFLTQYAHGLREINLLIDRYNLMTPAVSRQRVRINVREALEELEGRFPRLRPLAPGVTPEWESAVGTRPAQLPPPRSTAGPFRSRPRRRGG